MDIHTISTSFAYIHPTIHRKVHFRYKCLGADCSLVAGRLEGVKEVSRFAELWFAKGISWGEEAY